MMQTLRGRSGIEGGSAGQTLAWLSAAASVLAIFLALAWKSGLVPDRQVGSDCPCRQQSPESQVGANECRAPQRTDGIPLRMEGQDGP